MLTLDWTFKAALVRSLFNLLTQINSSLFSGIRASLLQLCLISILLNNTVNTWSG